MMTLKARYRSPWVLFVIVLLLGSMIRLGYGIARYHSSFTRTGTEFITIWDFDALEHVLIAKALMEDGTYTVAAVPGVEEKHVRGVGHDALFKAPLYQMFLAAVFAISGFSFALYFPLQALLGGLLSGLAALIALESFQDKRVAYFAGIAAATHPILVNSASQPYNENLFFALVLGLIWAFNRWLSTHLTSWALACGALGGLAILCRETALALFAILILFALFVLPRDVPRIRVVCVMLAPAALIIVPWSMRNYLREGVVVPVASNTGTALGIGNNECLAQEPILSWYYAEGPCSSLDIVRAQILDRCPLRQ